MDMNELDHERHQRRISTTMELIAERSRWTPEERRADYLARCVGEFQDGVTCVFTIRALDGNLPFETCVFDRRYKAEGGGVVVAAYPTHLDAQKGQADWVEIMVHNAPQELRDVGNDPISEMLEALEPAKLVFKKEH